MGCGTSMIKYFLFLFNFLTAIAGIAILAFGTVILVGIQKYNEHSDIAQELSGLYWIFGIIIGLGCFIFLISFLGCCGAIQESSCMTMTYATVLFILFLAQIAIIVVAFFGKGKIPEILNPIFNKWWAQHDDPNVQKQFNFIQELFHCCGNNGPQDYGFIGIVNMDQSCCGKGASTCTIINAYKNGCKDTVINNLTGSSGQVAYVSIAVAILEAISFIFGCTLANHIRNRERRAHY